MITQPIPDTAIVAEVIRLADAYATARDSRAPTEYYLPERDELLDYLRPRSPECLAGLYALYRLNDSQSRSPSGDLGRYRIYYDLAIRPHHREHAAADLAAKAPLADGLRRGLERLGFGDDPGRSRGHGDVVPPIAPRIQR